MSRNQRAIALILLASLNAFGFIDRVVIGLVTEKIKAEFLVSDLDIGLLGGTGFAVINTLAAVPIARLAERFKRSTVTAGFLLIGSGFTALMGVCAGFTQLLGARLGMAAGSAATEGPPHSMISDMYPPEKRASALSLFMLGIPVASILGSFLGGAVAEHYSWRGTFLVFGLMGGAISLLCFVFLKEPARRTVIENAAKPSTWDVAKVLFGSKTLVLLLAGICSVNMGSFGVNGFLPAFFSRNFGMDAAEAGLIFGLLSGIASFVGTLMGGYLSEYLARRNPRWLLGFPALGSVIGAPLFAIGVMSDNLLFAFPVMLVGAFFFYTAMGPAIATLHGSLDSFSRATGSALFLMIAHLLGQGAGPPLAGLVSDFAASGFYGSGAFGTECAGAAAQVAGSACALASAKGLQGAIAIMALFYLGGGALLYLAARSGAKAQTLS